MDFLISIVNKPWFFIALAAVVATYFLTLSIVLAVWTARDVSKRTKNIIARIGVPIFVFVFGFVGFVPYVFLRPKKTFIDRKEDERDRMLLELSELTHRCPSCEHGIQQEFAHCPHCEVQFKPSCSCGATLELDWKRCAFCGTSTKGVDRSRFKDPVQVFGNSVHAHEVVISKQRDKKTKSNKDSKKSHPVLLARIVRIFAIKK